MDVEIFPPGLPGNEQFAEHTRRAARNVGLLESVAELVLSLDAPEFEGSGYWQIERRGDGAVVATLYGSTSDVLRFDTRVAGIDPSRLDAEALARTPGIQLDVLRLDRWLHRNLLQLDDLLQARVRPHDVGRGEAQGLQACWDVWTDGRLRLWQHPGLSQAERRRIFYRIFAERGLLTPRHWRVFHDLWEGNLPGHDGLVRALERLPRV